MRSKARPQPTCALLISNTISRMPKDQTLPTRAAPTNWDAIIALGSNVGDMVANIDNAIEALLGEGDVHLVARSKNYRTPPWGVTDQDWFVNACVSVATDLSARELLARCQKVEKEVGRVRTKRWGPRVIDLDILVCRDEAINTADLVVPHPRITERAFVLVPLADVEPLHLISGKRVRDWLDSIDRTGVTLLTGSQK